MRHGARGWIDAGVIHAGCMQGTSIAEVHSKDGGQAMIFYQYRDGYVYARLVPFALYTTISSNSLPISRSRHYTTNWAAAWDPPVAIAKASKCTGIAATSWDGV